MKYDHERIEAKWGKFWEDRDVFHVEVDKTRPKYYVLDMFPYPSGSGLHVGHVTGYTTTDILARYKRQKGFNVLHPMGWDSFGLPAEQYALRTGVHPSITTQQNIQTYRRQLKALGFSYDWNREFATSDPKYYKWTQWIFTLLYQKGLAYEAEVLVNFCPQLGTVLANEEIEDGKSKEGGYPIERRPLRQWILKITAYADRLLEDLELLDWPDHLKKLQSNWIGRREGAKIHFGPLCVFTTRPDTLFGVSYLVIAPEHPLVDVFVSEECKEAVSAYRQQVSSKSDLERTDLSKEKTGVWTGGYVAHPLTGRQVPVWVSDYVLISYGTGVVMGVPAHDERDFAFAKKYDLPCIAVIDPDIQDENIPEGLTKEDMRREVLAGKRCWTGSGILIQSAQFTGASCEVAGTDIVSCLQNQGLGEMCVHFRLRDWLFSRQRYWGEPFPVLHLPDGSLRVLDLDELPLTLPDLAEYKPTGTGEGPLARAKEWIEVEDIKTGQRVRREANTMPNWAGSCWYYLRFCDPHNEHAAWDGEMERYWMPVDMYIGGVEHAVLHLLYARFWHKVLYDCGFVSTKEPFQTLRNQGLVTARSYQYPQNGLYVLPEEVYEKNGHFYHLGTDTELDAQMEKMSKSKLNGVSPDEIISMYGADTLRLYAMFMGPFDKEKVWNTDAVGGCHRFLSRFYALCFSDAVLEEDSDKTEESMRLISRLVHLVEKDIESMQFNTAIAKMMECLNNLSHLSALSRKGLVMFIQVLYPFAPHIAEELFEHFGNQEGITDAPFPTVNPLYLVDSTATYVVQINGKVRGKWELARDLSEKDIMDFIRKQPQLEKYLSAEILKVVYVPNKLLSLVVQAP